MEPSVCEKGGRQGITAAPAFSTDMNAANTLLSRQGQRLLQLGVALIFYSSFTGFAIPCKRKRTVSLGGLAVPVAATGGRFARPNRHSLGINISVSTVPTILVPERPYPKTRATAGAF